MSDLPAATYVPNFLYKRHLSKHWLQLIVTKVLIDSAVVSMKDAIDKMLVRPHNNLKNGSS